MRGNPNLVNPDLGEGSPLSSPPPTPWPSGPRRRQQHQPAPLTKNPKKLKNPKKVKKVTKHSEKWKKIKRRSDKKLKKSKSVKKRRKSTKNATKIINFPRIKLKFVPNKKLPVISIKNILKNQKKSIKLKSPLTNRIKTLCIVTSYMINCLVLETYLVTQELGAKMIDKTTLKNDKTCKTAWILMSRHKFAGTGVCNLENGSTYLKSGILARHEKRSRNKVKYVKKSDGIFDGLGVSKVYDTMLNHQYRNELVPKNGYTYSQANLNNINNIEKPVIVLNNSYIQGTYRIVTVNGRIYTVNRIGSTQSKAMIKHIKNAISTQFTSLTLAGNFSQPQSVLYNSLTLTIQWWGQAVKSIGMCVSTFSLTIILACPLHASKKNKLADLKLTNKLRERPIIGYPVLAVRTAPTHTWSSSSRTAVWLIGQGEQVRADVQTSGVQAWGPPELRVPDLVIGDTVGLVGDLEGEEVRAKLRTSEGVDSQKANQVVGELGNARTESGAQIGVTESGAQVGVTESGAGSELKEVRKRYFKHIDIINTIDKHRHGAHAQGKKNTINLILKLSSQNIKHPNPIPGKRLGLPFTIKGWEDGNEGLNEDPG